MGDRTTALIPAGMNKVYCYCTPPPPHTHTHTHTHFQVTTINASNDLSCTFPSNMLCLSSLHFPICVEGQSADDSPRGPDKVCHFSLLQHVLSVIFTFPHLCRGTVSWCQSYRPWQGLLRTFPSNMLCPSPLHLPICAEGRSAEDSAKGLD